MQMADLLYQTARAVPAYEWRAAPTFIGFRDPESDGELYPLVTPIAQNVTPLPYHQHEWTADGAEGMYALPDGYVRPPDLPKRKDTRVW
jgi:hypothetical protein